MGLKEYFVGAIFLVFRNHFYALQLFLADAVNWSLRK